MSFPKWLREPVGADDTTTRALREAKTALIRQGHDPNCAYLDPITLTVKVDTRLEAGRLAQQAGSNIPKPDPTMLLRQRLGGLSGTLNIKSADFLHAHVLDDAVIVFYIFGGQEGHLRDDVALYPSDTLITQIRMVMT